MLPLFSYKVGFRPFSSFSCSFSGAVVWGGLAKWLCSGLQIRLHRFDSGTRLQHSRVSCANSGRLPLKCADLSVLARVVK